MLHICRSNLVETLLDLLAHRLREDPLASPFTPELVVASSPAMARWVQLGLARGHGVAANLAYPLPASFVWQLARDLLGDPPEGDPLGLEVMAWRLYAGLPGLLPEPVFAPLRHYLQPLDNALKRWQLAERIADAFDRYQLYRPDLIRAWSDPQAHRPGDGATGEDAWQPLLWRHLIEGVGHHRVAVIDRLLARLGAGGPCPGLPERVSLFAVSSLPPLLVEVVQALAARTRVDLYLHCPTDQFWADLVDQKAQARRRLERPEEADLWEVGNPLLSSWGRQGQALQDLLLARETPLAELDAWAPPAQDSLLHRLQHDIYTLTGPTPDGDREAIAPDGSLQVRICHSALRECQVLHDRLLALFEAEPDLTPEDCLVMVPEIDAYAPYIEAVFERDESGARPYIPWNLSDTAPRDEHPLIQVFLRLLDLPNSRFSHSEVLSYLDVPELAQGLGLDAEAVAQVKAWLAQANLRWGLDGAHKGRLGLPEIEANTWAQVERRLFGGYALAAPGPGDTGFAGIAPIGSVEGARAETLGRFWCLLSRLQDYAERLAAPRTAAGWQETGARLVADFFGAGVAGPEAEDRLQRIRDALAELAEQVATATGEGPSEGPSEGAGEPLPLPLVRHWLNNRLGTASRHGRYFRGGVSFCGMRPMRSLPFPVICVLGLQDQAFPRRDRPLEFDLMRRHWRPGDPRKGDEDRYLFLETLLCARRRLYLSYVGRDLRRNTERQPSVLVRELLDAIDQRWCLAGGGRLSEALTSIHPLQPFSPRNYRGPEASFDGAWSGLAQAIAAPRPGQASAQRQAAWPEDRLGPAPDPLRDVTLTQLERFLRHPVRHFVNTRLGVYLREEEAEDDDEPFALAGLPRFLLCQRLVTDGLQGRAPDLAALTAEGVLPHGAFAALGYDRARDKVAPMVGSLTPYRAIQPTQVPVDLEFDEKAPGGGGPRRLVGQVGGIYAGPGLGLGLLRVRPSGLKGPDILALWLAHLAWCAMGPPEGERAEERAEEREALLIAEDADFRLRRALGPHEARAALAGYLAWYWEGLHRPLPVLPRASHAFAARTLAGKDPAGAVFAAWNGNDRQDIPGDRDDAYLQFVLRGRIGEPADFAGFPALALALYGQVLDLGSLT